MQASRSTNASGFTLTEVMVTVAIVAILGAIAYPSYRRQMMQSNRTDARVALLQIQVAQEKFFLQYNRYAGTNPAELSNPPNHATVPGMGIPAVSAHGHYTISLNTPTGTTYTATATFAGAQVDDHNCKTFSLTEARVQSSTNVDNNPSTGCWR